VESRSGLLSASAVRRLATRLDLRPTKQRGQNFVTDANTVRRIVALAGVQPDDVVLEIGPGLGSLTLGLLEAAERVVAVEIDPLLAGALPDTVAERLPARSAALSVVEADARLPGAMGEMIAPILPSAIRATRRPGQDRVRVAAEEHVLEVVGQLQARSAIIAAAVAAGRLRVAGGLYDLDEGRVRLVV